jgi:hypothetical protein
MRPFLCQDFQLPHLTAIFFSRKRSCITYQTFFLVFIQVLLFNFYSGLEDGVHSGNHSESSQNVS